MRLKLDENLGRRSAGRLRVAGHDVATVRDESLSGSPDPIVLDVASGEERALVTLDLGFANPLRFPPERFAGIAVLRVRDRPGRRDLDAVTAELLGGLERAPLGGRLWVVEPGRIRQYEAPQR